MVSILYRNLIVISIIIIMMSVVGNAKASLSSSGSWSYGETETTVGSSSYKSSYLNEIYSLSLSKRITKLINISGNATLMKRSVNDGTNETVSEEIFPTMSISFKPPRVYTLNMGFNRADAFPENGAHSASTNMFATMDLKIKKIPKINLGFSRSISETFNPQTVYSVSDSFSTGTNYNFILGTFKGAIGLGYFVGITEDKIYKSKQTTTTDNLNFNLNKSFFDKKFSMGFSTTMGGSKSSIESLSGLKRFGGEVARQGGYYLTPAAGLACVVLPCTESNLISTTAVVAPAPYTTMNLNTDSWGVGLGLVNSEQYIYKIEVYVDTNHNTVTLTQGGVDSMAFEVLIQDPAGTGGVDWQSAGGILKSTVFEISDAGEERFVIEFHNSSITSLEQFIMVRNTNALNGGLDINVNYIRAYAYFLGTETQKYESSSDRFSWNFKANFKPSKRFSSGYNFAYSTSTSSGQDIEREQYGQGLNGSVVLIPEKTSMSVSVNDNWTVVDGLKENKGNSLAYSLSHKFNPNLTTSYSNRQTKSYTLQDTSGDKLILTSESNSDSFSVVTKVYTGVNLQTSISFSERESLTVVSESESTSYRINLLPWSKVSVSVSGSENEYKSTNSSTGLTSTGSSTSLNSGISYVPNKKVSIGVGLNFEPRESQSINGSWRVSDSISFGLGGSFADNSASYNSNLRWRLMSRLSVNMRYLLSEADGTGGSPDSSVSSFFVSANMKFF